MSMLLYLSQLVNFGFSFCSRSRKFAEDVFRLISDEGVWIINSHGMFVHTSQISSAGDDIWWIYKNNCVSRFGWQKGLKGSLFLSCIFTIGDDTINMDNFLEETRCSPGVPFPVLMAAFSIYEKKLYNWPDAEFTAYLRNGDEVKFNGSNPPI